MYADYKISRNAFVLKNILTKKIRDQVPWNPLKKTLNREIPWYIRGLLGPHIEVQNFNNNNSVNAGISFRTPPPKRRDSIFFSRCFFFWELCIYT